MPTVVSFIWYMVVAGPHGGLVVMPGFFETRDGCIAAVAEFQKTSPAPGWTVQCVPAEAGFLGEEQPLEEEPPAEH